jgi:hypothetical protein
MLTTMKVRPRLPLAAKGYFSYRCHAISFEVIGRADSSHVYVRVLSLGGLVSDKLHVGEYLLLDEAKVQGWTC